jgi:hypothetical protein
VEPQPPDVPRPQPEQRREQQHRPIPQRRLGLVSGLGQRRGNLARPVDRRQDRVPVEDDHREHRSQDGIGTVLADREPQVLAQEVQLAGAAGSGHRRERTDIGGYVGDAQRRHPLHPLPCQERQEPAQHPGLGAHRRLGQPASCQRRRIRLELHGEDLRHRDPPAPGAQREPARVGHVEQAADSPTVEHLPLRGAVGADSRTEPGSSLSIRNPTPLAVQYLPNWSQMR